MPEEGVSTLKLYQPVSQLTEEGSIKSESESCYHVGSRWWYFYFYAQKYLGIPRQVKIPTWQLGQNQKIFLSNHRRDNHLYSIPEENIIFIQSQEEEKIQFQMPNDNQNRRSFLKIEIQLSSTQATFICYYHKRIGNPFDIPFCVFSACLDNITRNEINQREISHVIRSLCNN